MFATTMTCMLISVSNLGGYCLHGGRGKLHRVPESDGLHEHEAEQRHLGVEQENHLRLLDPDERKPNDAAVGRVGTRAVSSAAFQIRYTCWFYTEQIAPCFLDIVPIEYAFYYCR